MADVLDIFGKRIRKVFPTKQLAQAYCTNIDKEKYEFFLHGGGLTRKPVSLSFAIEEAIKSKLPLAPKSYMKYKSVYTTFEEYTKTRKLTYLREFTSADADKFRDILTSSDASAKTINFYLLAIKALFKEYVLKGLLVRNPFDHIKLERVKNKSLLEREEDYYSSEEIKNFFSQEMEESEETAFKALFLTGMRFGELSNLTWERVDWKNKIIQVRTTADFKTKTDSSERDIPFGNKMLEILRARQKTSASSFVFTDNENNQIRERRLLAICKSIAEKAGISKNATLHKFRHSFNSHLAQLGVDYSVRQYLMGHKPQSMTEHYTKIDPKGLHYTVSLLDKLLP
jgi:integrase